MKILRTLFTMMLLVAASGMSAQMRMVQLDRSCVFADPSEIEAEQGKTCELVIYLRDYVLDGEIRGYMFNLELPTGISLDVESYYDSDNELQYKVSSDAYEVSPELHEYSSSYYVSPGMTFDGVQTGIYTIIWYPSYKDAALKSTNGELVRFTLNVASDFAGGTGKIKNFNFVTVDNTSEALYYQDTEFYFTAKESSGTDPKPAEEEKVNALTVDPVSINPGGKGEIVVNMDYDTEESFNGFQFTLYLPEGISLYEDDDDDSYEYCYKDFEVLYGYKFGSIVPRGWRNNMGCIKKTDGGVIIYSYPMTMGGPCLSSTHGEFIRLPIKASSAFIRGTGEINDISIFISGGTTSVKVNDLDILFNGGDVYDNTVYMDDVRVKAGSETALPIKMKNTADIRGFQFTLDLPNGVTPVKSAKGKIQASLSSGRLPEGDEHTLSVSENEDGTLLFTANSLYEETFTGNDGEVLTLRVNVSGDMTDGDHEVLIKDIRLNEKDATKYYDVKRMKSKLTVWSYTPGDVNGDGEISVSDYIGVGNRIHNVQQEGFNEKAADVVADGSINISDYVGVANLILTGNIHGTTASARRSVLKANTDVSGIDNVLYVEPFAAEAGQQAVLSVKMKNTAEIRGFQFDLSLPEGVKAVKGSNGRIQAKLTAARLPEEDEHTLMVTEQADGTLRFLCGSEYMETFTGSDGEILTLTLDVAAGIANGEHAIVLSNIKLGENDMNVSYSTESVETTLTIGSTEPGPQPKPDGHNGEKWGDVNDDGTVDVADIATIISIMAANARLQMEMTE